MTSGIWDLASDVLAVLVSFFTGRAVTSGRYSNTNRCPAVAYPRLLRLGDY